MAGMLPAAIVFDFDGVIANSEPLHLEAFQQVLAGAGVHLPAVEYYERYLGYDDEGAFRAVMADRGRAIADGEVARLIAEKAMLLPRLLSSPGILVPGAAECLDRLGAVLPMAIASGARREEIELVLDARGLRRHFPVIVAAGETARSKPHPDPYARAVEALGERGLLPTATPAGRCVAVEDSHWGIASAKAAGLACIGITTSYPRHALGDADLVVDALDELTPALLAGLTGHGHA